MLRESYVIKVDSVRHNESSVGCEYRGKSSCFFLMDMNEERCLKDVAWIGKDEQDVAWMRKDGISRDQSQDHYGRDWHYVYAKMER
jgi:hypothetical protein